jgi:hypothetical protein
MSGKQKLLEKTRRNSRNVALHDFEALISAYGYIEEGAKHPKAIIGVHTLPYKKESRIKACYVKGLLDMIDELPK